MKQKEANAKKYDLEDRTFEFAKAVRLLIGNLSKGLINAEDAKQLVRASGSVGANYIEANEAFSKKDFLLRVKICRKESKESRFWLKLLSNSENKHVTQEIQNLIQEATELMNIFGAIIRKSE